MYKKNITLYKSTKLPDPFKKKHCLKRCVISHRGDAIDKERFAVDEELIDVSHRLQQSPLSMNNSVF